MKPRYKFIVINYWGIKDVTEQNQSIQDESNKLLYIYEDVDVQGMVKTNDHRTTVIYKVKLEEINELQDWGT